MATFMIAGIDAPAPVDSARSRRPPFALRTMSPSGWRRRFAVRSSHVVITAVARDDLKDGGWHFADDRGDPRG